MCRTPSYIALDIGLTAISPESLCWAEGTVGNLRPMSNTAIPRISGPLSVERNDKGLKSLVDGRGVAYRDVGNGPPL